MKRWLAILILLAPCSGCMLFDDMAYYDDRPPWATAQQPTGTCGQAIRNVSASQTAEPELLRR